MSSSSSSSSKIRTIERCLDPIQSTLDFRRWTYRDYPQFATTQSLGRAVTIGTILGIALGVHLTLLCHLSWHRLVTTILSSPTDESSTADDDGSRNKTTTIRTTMMMQWTIYMVGFCSFHLLEFFTTALYNPRALSTDSFLVNQSMAYTAAWMLSWIEFWIRYLFLTGTNYTPIVLFGIIILIVGQSLRSSAMMTCKHCFNHLIQRSQNDDHHLVTHGIYHYFRHPSYVGFFYWSIGTQLVLCNPICTCCYAWASWRFFDSRIPYEERLLRRQYPDEYPSYAKRTWLGIPFIRMGEDDEARAATTTVSSSSEEEERVKMS